MLQVMEFILILRHKYSKKRIKVIVFLSFIIKLLFLWLSKPLVEWEKYPSLH